MVKRPTSYDLEQVCLPGALAGALAIREAHVFHMRVCRSFHELLRRIQRVVPGVRARALQLLPARRAAHTWHHAMLLRSC